MSALSPCTFSVLTAIPWLRHTVTTRNDSLPLGGDMSLTTGAACPEGVIANRRQWLEAIGRTAESAVMSGLVHGTNIRTVTCQDEGRGDGDPSTFIEHTDGMITNEPGLTLMMCFADCVPLIVVDTEKHVIGLAHAGWRGTLAGMAGHLVAEMRAIFHCRPETLVAIIGPSIGPMIYDVGPEVVCAFSKTYPQDMLFTRNGSSSQLDLWRGNAAQFRRAGLASSNIHISGICTFEQGDRFFSHRYAQHHNEREGRFAVLLSIEE